ncbi:MAG: S1 RNA-binding domain-containing protein, partial [Bacteroidota bacterium]
MTQQEENQKKDEAVNQESEEQQKSQKEKEAEQKVKEFETTEDDAPQKNIIETAGENVPEVPEIEDAQEEETFDWENLDQKDDDYDPEERAKFEQLYDKTLSTIKEKEIVEGTVVSVTKKEVVINIGYKSEGVVSRNEFRHNPDLKAGDKVEVYIENQEDKDGQLVLSHKKARTLRAWERVNQAHDNDEIIQGYIKCRTKGGMIVDAFGIETFLPGSQIDV